MPVDHLDRLAEIANAAFRRFDRSPQSGVVRNESRRSLMVEADDREAIRHRFQVYGGERISEAGEQECVGGAVKARHLLPGYPPKEFDAARKSQSRSHLLP